MHLIFSIQNLKAAPRYIFWTKSSATLTSSKRPGMSLETVRVSGTSTSDLTLTSVTVVDSGEYSCHSDVVIAASVQIYITSGKLKKILLLDRVSHNN